MKKRALLALNAMAVSVICIAAAPAHAVDHWSLQQFEQIQTRTAGQGYAVGFARNVGTVTQKEISLDAGRGIGLNFSNLNVFGSSEAVGVAASVNGQSSVNVIAAQNIDNFAGTVRMIVR
jgi:hypothetical protein